MLLNHLKIKNFKSFHNADIALNLPLVALVGLNGAGKSNILKAIKIALADFLDYKSFLSNRNINYLNEDSSIVLSFVCTEEEYLNLNKKINNIVKKKDFFNFYIIDLHLDYYVKTKKLVRYVLANDLKKIDLSFAKQTGIALKLTTLLLMSLKNKKVIVNGDYAGYLINEINNNFLFNFQYINKLELILDNYDNTKLNKLLNLNVNIRVLFENLIPKQLLTNEYFEDNRVLIDYFSELYQEIMNGNYSDFSILSQFGFGRVIDLSFYNNQLSNKMPILHWTTPKVMQEKIPIFMALLNLTKNKDLLNKWSYSFKNVVNLLNKLNKDLEKYFLANNEILRFEINGEFVNLGVTKLQKLGIRKKALIQNSFAIDNISMGTRDLLIYELLLKNYYSNEIILLDEPNSFLHIASQEKLVQIIQESIKRNNKIIFTTHSPFMISENIICNTFLVENYNNESIVYNVDQIKHREKTDSNMLSINYNDVSILLSKLGFISEINNLNSNKLYLIVEGKTDLLGLQIIDLILGTNLLENFNIKFMNGVKNADKLLMQFKNVYNNVIIMVDNDHAAHLYCDKYLNAVKNIIYIYDNLIWNMDKLFKLSPVFLKIWNKNYPKLKMKLPIYAIFLDIILIAKENNILKDIIPAKLKKALKLIYKQIIK